MTRQIFEREVAILREGGATDIDDIERFILRDRAAGATPLSSAAKAIDRAIREKRRVRIVYRSVWNDTATERVITPIELKTGAYEKAHVIAYCHLRNETRTFRLDGIIEAALSDSPAV